MNIYIQEGNLKMMQSLYFMFVGLVDTPSARCVGRWCAVCGCSSVVLNILNKQGKAALDLQGVQDLLT